MTTLKTGYLEPDEVDDETFDELLDESMKLDIWKDWNRKMWARLGCTCPDCEFYRGLMLLQKVLVKRQGDET